ncbi:25S rRNA (adenine645-N1)-methyltransferase [Glugoides intestinalis]
MGLAEELQKKLEGGKFRLLNEKMYKNKELNEKETREYHKYYKNQIKKWPADPKAIIIEKIINSEQAELKIADLGCGSAEIAKKFPNVVSFDKYPLKKEIIKCELKKIPTDDKGFDMAVCCLSLMMSGITTVMKEINRILKVDGIFYFADLASRIENKKKFISNIEDLGFKLKDLDKKNPYFFVAGFVKVSDFSTEKKLPTIKLRDWSYKKR